MGNYVIRAAGESDEDAVLEILSELFGADITSRYQGLYRENPHGRALTWLAFEAGSAEPAAITSVFPRKVWVDGRYRLGSIGGDCYVRPSARRQGLATRLHRACFADMKSMGVQFMYGSPWENNLKALVKAGSTEVGTYKRFSRMVSRRVVDQYIQSLIPESMAGRISADFISAAAAGPYWMLEWLRRSYRSQYILVPVERFGDEWRRFLERATETHKVCCVRDVSYLNWRYIDNGAQCRTCYAAERNGEIVGMLVLERRDDELVIVDILTKANSGDIGHLLKLTLDMAATEDRARVSLATMPNKWMSRHLLRHGFLSRVGRGFQVACDPQDQQEEILHDPGNWHYAHCDQDPRPEDFQARPLAASHATGVHPAVPDAGVRRVLGA